MREKRIKVDILIVPPQEPCVPQGPANMPPNWEWALDQDLFQSRVTKALGLVEPRGLPTSPIPWGEGICLWAVAFGSVQWAGGAQALRIQLPCFQEQTGR